MLAGLRPMWGTGGRRQALISPALLSQLRKLTLWQGCLATHAAATADSLASSSAACPPPQGGTAWAQQRSLPQWRSFASLPSIDDGQPQPPASHVGAAAARGSQQSWRKPGRQPDGGGAHWQAPRVAKADLHVIAAASSGTLATLFLPSCCLLHCGSHYASNVHN